jgi:hypothetical protein
LKELIFLALKMPFKSKAQYGLCRRKHDPRWDCDKWLAETPGGLASLPERKSEGSGKSPRRRTAGAGSPRRVAVKGKARSPRKGKEGWIEGKDYFTGKRGGTYTLTPSGKRSYFTW